MDLELPVEKNENKKHIYNCVNATVEYEQHFGDNVNPNNPKKAKGGTYDPQQI